MSRFFIERPIFAWVIAIIVMMAGVLAIRILPISQYPTIAPPAIVVNATYPGADAKTLENSVTQVIEQQLTGIDHLLYFSSISSSTGNVTITVTFEAGTNPDIAQVQVQNKLAQATPLLPPVVQQQGVTVTKSQSSFLLLLAVYDSSGRYTDVDTSDYINSKIIDPISRVEGVGNIQTFGSQYAIRIWLDPYKLNNYKMMPSDVQAAVQAQNVQVSAGQLGAQPVVDGAQLNATVTAQSRLQTVEQFKNIILRTAPDGSVVHLGDVARLEMGSETYGSDSRMNGMAASGVGIQLAPGSNALRTADAVKARAHQLEANFPPGMKLAFPVDTTTFIKLSIHQVVQTLIEAIFLVVAVMFLFLQNWRATLIPAVAVPVVLLGTFGVLAMFGYSINTLTLFALVLAIGLLVDDAIVVVENVERIMREEGLSPKNATIKSMREITGALVGIALVLSAVFLPMAFFGGSTVAIYRQFSVTIVSAMTLSVLVALVLTPALCATVLKPIHQTDHLTQRGFFGWFNRTFAAAIARYDRTLQGVIARPVPALIGYGVIVLVLVVLFVRLPSAFLPEEDQGSIITLITLPVGAVEQRTTEVAKQVEHFYLTTEQKTVDTVFVVAGFSFAGNGQNQGMSFVHLKPWKDRPGQRNSSQAITQRAMGAFSKIRDGQVFALTPPAVQELGNSSGFDVYLEDQGNLGHEALVAARNQLLGMASKDRILSQVRPNGQEDTPQLHVDIDQARAGAIGLAQSDVNATLSAAWGGTYINDFIDRGRVKRVFMQGDAPFRMAPDDLSKWFVRSSTGSMAPFSAFSSSTWTFGPAALDRYNGYPALEIQGQAAPGQSSGAAMKEMETLMAKLPPGVGYEWTGLSYQERLSGSEAPLLYALSILVVFLCLAALYESWSIPLSVLMVIPLGVVGALLAATMRGLYNDIYFQVGLLTTIGISAKNAILIVEFAESAERRGVSAREAALQAARLRLRPILMTSLAFIAGVFPLVIASGAGASSQNDIGTGVVGGMLTAASLAIFLVPLFYILVRGTFRRPRPGSPAAIATLDSVP